MNKLIISFMLLFSASVFAADVTSIDTFLSLNGTSLGQKCGYLKTGWMTRNDAATIYSYKQNDDDVLAFYIDSEHPNLRWKLTVNDLNHLTVVENEDGSKYLYVRESWKKSMPPGPGREAGFLSQYTLSIQLAKSGEAKIQSLVLYLEDFDPRSKSWSEFFDIRLNLDSYVLCE